MNFKTLSRDLWLLTNFRNGWEMVRYLRGFPSISQAKLLNGKSIVHPLKGGLVEAILENWFEKSYFPNGFYVPKSEDVIVDIGANIGLFTIQAAQINPKARIAAFEPFPENFECLSRNAINLGLKNVTLHTYAVSSHYEQGLIVETGDRSLDHQLIKQSEKTSDMSNCTPVDVIPLEGIFELMKVNTISLLKVDIEGAEHDVFESTSEKTLKRIDRIALEYHDNLRPGTLSLITQKLASTHHVKIIPSNLSSCGLLFAVRKVEEISIDTFEAARKIV
ncbi:MAG TPA: FkbM family methyltransferase [Candidatus Sericytochromatia bacterium]|jgi:FkbM family methyltransferase